MRPFFSIPIIVEIRKNMKIIDAHSHLGDNQYPYGGDIIEQTGIKQKTIDSIMIAEVLQFKFSWLNHLFYQIFKPIVVRDTINRNKTASRENMRKSMDEAGVSYTACLPVSLNFVSFDALVAAMKKDPGIIPFTGVDHTKDYDYNQVYTSHVKSGAKGLKLHPIVQKLSLTDKKTYNIVEAFAPYELPVLFHCGITYYYVGKEKKNQTPEYGSIHYAERLVKSFPKVNFIAGHSGAYQVRDVINRLGKYKNVWVDTSFQSSSCIRKLIKTFGPEKVLYASDWPYGQRIPAIMAARSACGGDTHLEKAIFHDNAATLFKLTQ
ncbi:MAG: amidohydrolase 2 [Candidatus Magnetoglobus multicellularis str. Araruama]|uniref:Amidohydrolase 2 n=2 Tax=Candidatus Magnetoglobus multicellularis str. Araruama TaxID=890399 RepID=A0A1V1NSR9_9BACT|nr:MAG: amidohydrolase 2 [Candidatus Magnetoglobus multicellularis str. Araruama]